MTALAAPDKAGHFEYKVGALVYPVLPGDHLVIAEPGAAVTTLLGSCVAACIRDTESGRGGLNHFLLPGTDTSDSARYGAYAMEVLINEILRQGARREGLEAKVFGGGEVIATSGAESVGQKNAAFVRNYLRTEGIKVVAEDLGGCSARRVFFFPDTGKVRVQYLAAVESKRAIEGERRFQSQLAEKPKTGSVELFS